MTSLRLQTLLVATLLAAGASVFGAGSVGAAPTAPSSTPMPTTPMPTTPMPGTSMPSTSPSPSSSSPSWPTYPTDYPPSPSSSGSTSPSPVGPTGPYYVRLAAVTAGSITLDWNPSTPGDHPIGRYEITYYQASNNVERVQPVPGDTTTVTLVDGILPNDQYVIRIVTIDTAGLRYVGGLISVITPASTDRTPPSRPTDLTVASSGPGGAVLTWTPSTDNVAVTGYFVFIWDRLKASSTLVATVPGPTATVPGTTGVEQYFVRARDAAGNVSAPSDLISAPIPPTPACTVTYRTSAQWGGGFVADLTIANPAAAAVNDWSLTFEFGGDQTISSSWGGRAAQNGARVSITPASWNLVIPAGGSVTVGLLGRWTTNAAPPTVAKLKGVPCTLS
jgi:hypothetical protein